MLIIIREIDKENKSILKNKKIFIITTILLFLTILSILIKYNEATNNTPENVTKDFIESILTKDKNLFLNSIDQDSVNHLRQRIDSFLKSKEKFVIEDLKKDLGKVNNINDIIEDKFLSATLVQLNENLQKKGLTNISDMEFVQLDNSSKSQATVNILSNGRKEKVPVIKKNDYWYVIFSFNLNQLEIN